MLDLTKQTGCSGWQGGGSERRDESTSNTATRAEGEALVPSFGLQLHSWDHGAPASV